MSFNRGTICNENKVRNREEERLKKKNLDQSLSDLLDNIRWANTLATKAPEGEDGKDGKTNF